MLLANREKLWPQLERIGEDAVRRRFANNEYESFEENEVEEWLRRQDIVNALTESKNAEKAARSAKNAAWAAVLVAIVSIVLSLVGMFYGKQ